MVRKLYPVGAPTQRLPPDTILIGIVGVLVALGLVMIFSASSATALKDYHDSAYFLKRQAVWFAIAAVLALVAYRIDYRHLRAVAPTALLLSLVGLALVLVPHVGLATGGARRWLGGGPFSFQPSEFAKLGLVIYLAAALSRKGERIRSLVTGVFPLALAAGALIVLVVLEPDMGTASLLALTAAAMLFAGGARIVHLLMVAAATTPWVAILILSSHYKRDRIFAFIDPWRDQLGSGFHIVQSLLALGSGGLFGEGVGYSRQKFFYLPEQYTDFIYAIVGEELGLIGTVLIVVLFTVVAYRGIRIALSAPDRFGFFLAIGCTCVIVIQAFVNIGVVTSSWPVTGVPLPFFSFGGSSLIVSLLAVALLINVGRYRVDSPA